MGLAEPRKRIKLSHDPRNTQWTSDTTSFGHKYMLSSGWTPGTALGASSIPTPASESSAAKVRIAVKDDTLGLGASLKSRNVEHQRTGLDAFQGLLGRLNAKDADAVAAVEQKIENKKLAMFALGRWGGMTFVPGGKLIQEDPTKPKAEEIKPTTSSNELADQSIVEKSRKDKKKDKRKHRQTPTDSEDEDGDESNRSSGAEKRKDRIEETPEERSQRKAEKKKRKEERQVRREAKRLKKLQRLKDGQDASGTDTPASDVTSLMTSRVTTGTSTPVLVGDKLEQKLNVTAITQQRLSNGRHLLRGRNIQAKRLAFSDEKGLDQIFMKAAQQMQV